MNLVTMAVIKFEKLYTEIVFSWLSFCRKLIHETRETLIFEWVFNKKNEVSRKLRR